MIAERAGIPLAAGENLRGESAFDAAIAGGYLRFLQPDVGKWGGISGCREVASRAVERGLAFCPHWLAGGVGLAASMHLLAAAGGGGYAEVDANPNPLREVVFPLRRSSMAGRRCRMRRGSASSRISSGSRLTSPLTSRAAAPRSTPPPSAA